MKKHKAFIAVITALLIVATLEITSPQIALTAPAAHAEMHQDGAIGCILLIIICIVVGIILWGLVQMCKPLSKPPPPNNDQPTNITIAVQVSGPDTYMQFDFDATLATNCLAGGSVTDEVGNVYQLECAYNLFCSSNPNGPWKLDALVTNWMGGTLNMLDATHASASLTNQEIALYDTNGVLLAARRWWLTDYHLSNAIMPRIVMPPKHLPEQFYRLVLLEQ